MTNFTLTMGHARAMFGIAFTEDGGHPSGNAPGCKIIGWKQDKGKDQVWTSYAEALEANDLDGWRGYVRLYPSGREVPKEMKP